MRISDWSSDVCATDLSAKLQPTESYRPQVKVAGKRENVMRADERVRLILYVALFATDILAVFLGFLVANYLRHGSNLSPADLTATLALLPVFGGIAINSNAYGIQALRGVPHGLSRVILSLLFTAAPSLFVAVYMKARMKLSCAIFGR